MTRRPWPGVRSLQKLVAVLNEDGRRAPRVWTRRRRRWCATCSCSPQAPDVLPTSREDGFVGNPHLDAVRRRADAEGAEVVPVCAAIEEELQPTTPIATPSCTTWAWTSPALNRVIRAAYKLLGLQTYFTAGVGKCVPDGEKATAPQAAGVIHRLQERAVYLRETIAFDDFKGKESGARDASSCAWKARTTWSRKATSCIRFNVWSHRTADAAYRSAGRAAVFCCWALVPLSQSRWTCRSGRRALRPRRHLVAGGCAGSHRRALASYRRRRFPLTPLLYALIAAHVLILDNRRPLPTRARGVLGAGLVGLARNHYDRLGHFAQGF